MYGGQEDWKGVAAQRLALLRQRRREVGIVGGRATGYIAQNGSAGGGDGDVLFSDPPLESVPEEDAEEEGGEEEKLRNRIAELESRLEALRRSEAGWREAWRAEETYE
eukprot:Hpha_TRINITY_DN5589_c0_g1::TRINITY_DN5589_c0_g1_i1::g.93748::m.93748